VPGGPDATRHRNAQASESAAPFWEGLGFQRTDHPGITHILKREKVGG